MLTLLKQIVARVRGCFERRGLDQDLNWEIESHLTMLAEDHIRRGLTPEQARRAALLEFGGVTQLRETHREIRGLPLLETFLQDVQYSLRMLRNNPGFTAIAVLTLAIGIGVNTAIFTAYNAVALRPVQAPESGRLVQVTRTTGDPFFSFPDYMYYRNHNRTFAGLVAMAFQSFSMTSGGTPAPVPHATIAGAAGFQFPRVLAGSAERTMAVVVSGNYFKILGVHAIRGRTFLPEEDTVGAQPVALVSYNFWDRRFARDPGLLGRNLKLNGVDVTIVGITPRDFSGTASTVPDFWVPLALESRLAHNADLLHDRNSVCCRMFGRLAKGIAKRQAAVEMNTLAARLRVAFPEMDNRPSRQKGRFVVTTASPFGPLDSESKAVAMLVLGAVSLVLLIACANVASLLLARSAARQREIAVRLAIGAGRSRLIRQLLTESAAMSLFAGALGIVLSWWSLHFLMVQVAASIPFGDVALHLAPDARVLAYMLFLSMISTIAFGLAPALEASKPNLTSALKDEGAAFGGQLRKSRLRDLLVGTQVAVSLVLLIAAGLLARSSQRALTVDLGFNYHNIVFLDVTFPQTATPARIATIRTQLALQLEGLPEVQSVAGASRLPLAGGIRVVSVSLNGRSPNDSGSRKSFFNLVTPGYFDTMGIPILQGRNFAARDLRDDFNFDGSTVVVSEATAMRFWPGQDPIGQRVAFGPGRDSWRFAGEKYPHSVSSLVIGVAKDVRSVSLNQLDDTCLYFPVTRAPSIVMRVRRDEGKAVAEIQRLMQTTHSDLGAEVADSRAAFSNQAGFVLSRVGAIGSAMIGILGLLMASVGIYGTVGFAVMRRTQEIGIRMALGAQRRDVLGLVLSETMRPVVVGLAIGLAGAAMASHLMSSLLFGLSTLDPVAFLGVSAVLAAVALLASYLPARRATRVDPMIALRYE